MLSLLRSLPFILVAALSAQTTIQIDAGSGPPLIPEPYFSGAPAASYKYSTPFLATQSGVYRTLRATLAGKPMDYDIPVANGQCALTFSLIEPRPAGPNPATDSAPDRRVFKIVANGIDSGPVDIFRLSGAQTPLTLPLGPATVSDGHLRITIAPVAPGILGAVVSGISADCTPTPAPPAPLTGVPCASLTPANGIVLVIALPDGSCLPTKVLAAPGFLADTIETWTDADEQGNVRAQVVFALLKPTP